MFSLAGAAERDAIGARLRALGGEPVAPEKPYWSGVDALAFEAPDGWRVVLVPGPGI